MKFKVSAKVKGSLILKTLNRACPPGIIVHVEGDGLYADDIQRAIKSGLLTPCSPEEKIEERERIIDKTNEAVIINKTDRVVIIGNFPIRPNGSAIKDLSKIDMNALRKSVKNGLIQVITDVDEGVFDEVKEVTPQDEKEAEIETGIEILEESTPNRIRPEDELAQLIEESDEADKAEYEDGEMSEPREDGSKAFVWDAGSQSMKKPKIVPKTIQKMITEEEPDVDMVDALDEVNDTEEDEEIKSISDKIESMKKKLAQKQASKKKASKKKASKKKASKKKASKKKASKKKASKKKESKVIKMKFTKESEDDVAQAMDSMGNPLSNEMTHMIDDANGTGVSFCDQ